MIMMQRREAQAKKDGPVKRREGVGSVGRKIKDEDMAKAIAQAKRDHEMNGGPSNRSSVVSQIFEEELSIAFRLDRPISIEIDKSDCFGSEWEFSKPQKDEEREREEQARLELEKEAEKLKEKDKDEDDRRAKLRRRKTHDPSRMQSALKNNEEFK